MINLNIIPKYKSLLIQQITQNRTYMWSSSSLQQLKTQVIKSKSYKSKPKDAQFYMLSFQKYINTNPAKSLTNPNTNTNSNTIYQKVIEYFIQIFVACIHLHPHQKINQMFRKIVHWINEDRGSNAGYFIVKYAVEICEREYEQYYGLVYEQYAAGKNYGSQKQREQLREKQRSGDTSHNPRSVSRQRSKSRDRQRGRQSSSQDRRQKIQDISSQNIKNQIKTILYLVRKSGDRHMLNHDYFPIYRTFIEYYLQRLSKSLNQIQKDSQKQTQTQQKQASLIQNQSDPKQKQKNKQKQKQKQKGKENQKNRYALTFHSPILSQLSTILSNKNKSEVGEVIRRYIEDMESANGDNPLSAYIWIYILIQIRNIPHLLQPILSPRTFPTATPPKLLRHTLDTYNQLNSIDNPTDPTQKPPKMLIILLQYFLRTYVHCLRSSNYGVLVNLYKLYPLNGSVNENGGKGELLGSVRNAEELLNRVYMHLWVERAWVWVGDVSELQKAGWQNWKKQFITQHSQYIQSTSLKSFLHTHHKNLLNIQYVLKLLILSSSFLHPRILQPSNQQLFKSEISDVLNVLKSNIGARWDQEKGKEQVNEFFGKLWALAQDCRKVMEEIVRKRRREQSQGFLSKISYKPNKNLSSQLQLEQQFRKQLLDLSQYLQQQKQQQYKKKKENFLNKNQMNKLKDNNSHSIEKETDKRKKQFLKKIKLIIRNETSQEGTDKITGFMENWKIILHVMFQQTKKSVISQNTKPHYQQSQLLYYSKQTLFILGSLSIKPRILTQPPPQYTICIESPLSSLCLQILSQITVTTPKQTLISQIKKQMSTNFDRVEQPIIRDYICKDIFLTRCLLMTNHSAKCRFLMDLVSRYYDMPKRRDKREIEDYLAELFAAVPREAVVEYCRFMAAKDRLGFRMVLYERGMVELEYLVDMGLYDAVVGYSGSNQQVGIVSLPNLHQLLIQNQMQDKQKKDKSFSRKEHDMQ